MPGTKQKAYMLFPAHSLQVSSQIQHVSTVTRYKLRRFILTKKHDEGQQCSCRLRHASHACKDVFSQPTLPWEQKMPVSRASGPHQGSGHAQRHVSACLSLTLPELCLPCLASSHACLPFLPCLPSHHSHAAAQPTAWVHSLGGRDETDA